MATWIAVVEVNLGKGTIWHRVERCKARRRERWHQELGSSSSRYGRDGKAMLAFKPLYQKTIL
jgi:hypothetical protein